MGARRWKDIFGELPADLRAVSDGYVSYDELATKQEQVLTDVSLQIAENDNPKIAALTQLDLLFMLSGYLPEGQNMYQRLPPSLVALIDQQCQRFPELTPFMTYEMIIDLNSEEYRRTGFMRVFSDGADGESERDFYFGHTLAEEFARSAVRHLAAVVGNPGAEDVLARFVKARQGFEQFNKYMAAYARLSKQAFGYFRRYLVTYPDGTRNASGAFMPSVQEAELVLTAPTDTYTTYLNESDRYFPAAARPAIAARRTAAASGTTIEGQLERGELVLDPRARQELLAVVDAFIQFRMLHLGVTKAQIPAAFSSLDNLTRTAIALQDGERQILEPEFEGSAGFDVRNVLTNSVYRLLRLRERLIKQGDQQ